MLNYDSDTGYTSVVTLDDLEEKMKENNIPFTHQNIEWILKFLGTHWEEIDETIDWAMDEMLNCHFMCSSTIDCTYNGPPTIGCTKERREKTLNCPYRNMK